MIFDQAQPADERASRPQTDAETLEALRQAEVQYRSIFDNSLHGIYQSTPDGRFLNANSAYARMLGYDSAADLVANYRSIEQDYYADPSVRPTLRRTLEEGGTVRGFECQARRRDGTIIWTRENFYAVRDAAGRLLYYEGSVEDITERKEAEIALRESEERYRRLFADANDIIYTTDLSGNYTSINGAGESLTGYARDEIVRMNFRQITAPEFVERVRGMLERKLRGEEATTCYETEIVSKLGERRNLEVSTQLIRTNDGTPVGVQGIARDVTERKRAEAAMSRSEERYRELFENANDIVYTHDLAGNFTSLNKTGERITGYTREEACRINIAQVVVPEYIGLAHKMIGQKHGAEEATRYELEITAKDGRRVPLEISTRLILRDGVPIGVQGIARDITERKRTEEKLRYIAFHDSLTGLPNRALFTDHLHLAVEAAKRQPGCLFAVLFLDLDRFKVINDSLGHTIGDELLVALSRRLDGSLRAGDTVARLGGDEFAILLNNLDRPGDALHVADRVQQEIAEPFRIGGHEVFTTASIGIALSTTGYTNEEDVLRDADTVMYRAKAQGAARARRQPVEVGERSATRRRAQGVLSLLPAHRRVGVGMHYGLRGARALAAPGARTRLARRVHPHRRRDGLDRPARNVGTRSRVPADEGVARDVAAPSRSETERQPIGSPVRASRSARTDHAHPRRDALRSALLADRTHRVGRDGERQSNRLAHGRVARARHRVGD
jgi:diguanylate cyclase (GGDEF)-like protein/PAS domain S-box-containing protein